jgi:hypothetical protein
MKGITKIISGILLMIAGALGFIFGKNVKSIALRTLVIVGSLVSIFFGFYLFVDGIEDLAIGKVGDYELGQQYIQPMIYASRPEFLAGMKGTMKELPSLRRLKFECPDKSKGFRVYLTRFGVFGAPREGITCDDGFKLLSWGT